VKRINKKWGKDSIFFDQEDYRNLNEAYWTNFTHHMLTIECSEAQTSALVARCRKEGVTVNTAITTAFAGAQVVVQGEKPYHSNIGIAASLRDRLQHPAGEVMGFYAGLAAPKFTYDTRLDFWDNARRLHRKAKALYTDKHVFQGVLLLSYLEPAIREASTFKMLGNLVPPEFTRYEKISAFSKRDDVVLSLLKRRKMDSLDTIALGLAVTNLTRLDFPRTYGALTLERLFMNPGSAVPLANVGLIVGAVTCSGKLSVVLEYAEETVDTHTMQHIQDRAVKTLMKE
jgi:NRPS condensation-like uncharacterized protein